MQRYKNYSIYAPIRKKIFLKGHILRSFEVLMPHQSVGKDAKIVDAYQLNGQKRNGVQHGLNIVRMSDGTTRKVVVK